MSDLTEEDVKNQLEQELLKNQSYSNQQKISVKQIKELEETCERWERLYAAAQEGEKQALTEAFMLREALKATNMYFVCTAAEAAGSMARWDGNPGMLGQKLDQLKGGVLSKTPKAEALGELMKRLQERFQEISDMSITSERDQRKRGLFRDWKDVAREAQKDLEDFFGKEQVQLNGP